MRIEFIGAPTRRAYKVILRRPGCSGTQSLYCDECARVCVSHIDTVRLKENARLLIRLIVEWMRAPEWVYTYELWDL